MSIVDKFAETAFEFAKASSDDEYQEQMWYKSAAISYFAMAPLLYGMGAILAWALPGNYAWFCLLAVAPLVLAEMLGQQWLKERAPRPRAHINSKFFSVSIILAVIMIAGLAYKAFIAGDTGGGVGVIIGALVGAGVAAIFAPKALNKIRTQDEKRIDSALEDDD